VIDLDGFEKGMRALGDAFNRPITPAVLDVFGRVLSRRLDTKQWERAVTRALEAESFFPPPAVLLRYGIADGAPQARAGEVYAAILSRFEAGECVGPRDVRERFGEAAFDAFVAAGGSRAFSWCEPKDEPFRLKRFVEAWTETVEQSPERALPAGAEAPKLEAFTPSEASSFLRLIGNDHGGGEAA